MSPCKLIAPPEIDITTLRAGDVVLVRPKHELDADEMKAMVEHLSRIAGATGAKFVTLSKDFELVVVRPGASE